MDPAFGLPQEIMSVDSVLDGAEPGASFAAGDRATSRQRTLARISRWCGLVAAAIGALTIIGWLTGAEYLASLRTRYIPMAPSTGLCFAMLGFAVNLRARNSAFRIAARICAAIVAAVAVAKLVEFATGYRLGLDEFLVSDPDMFGVVRKGRMAPITAFSFLLSSVSLVCIMSTSWRRYAGFAATLVSGSGIAVLLGYMHGTPLLYGGAIIPVALTTGGAFLFLSVSLVAAAGEDCWPLKPLLGTSARSLLLRWFLPVVIAGTLINSYLESWFLNSPEFNPALVSALSTLGFAFIISAVISQVSRLVGGRIDQAEAGRNAAQNALKSLNAVLEQRIAARTMELRAKNEETQRLLTDLTQSHEKLKNAQLQLIQAEKMQSVGSLAAGIAHEVKNPLAILEMGIGCLVTRQDLDSESLQLVFQEMREAVARANSVISGLLDYSSSKELNVRASDLHGVIEQALHLLRHEFVNRKISVVRNFIPDLPVIQIDTQKIEQVFVNLFTNACHAMSKGGTLTVATALKTLGADDVEWQAGDRSGNRFREDERVVVVTVRDTGPGIPPEKLSKVFDPFFTTKPTGQGTGLGLTVAAKIVELHGGRLELNNAPECGAIATATFHLRQSP